MPYIWGSVIIFLVSSFERKALHQSCRKEMGYQPKELETNCNKSVSVLEPLTDEKFFCQSALEILGRKRLTRSAFAQGYGGQGPRNLFINFLVNKFRGFVFLYRFFIADYEL